MSEHTPGPWSLKKGIEIWVMAGPLHVATIPRAGDGDWSEANARLIAAAPDLLEAAKRLSELSDQIWVKLSNDEGRLMQAAWKQMDAAIARATGDQS